jgi:hypothetical protein
MTRTFRIALLTSTLLAGPVLAETTLTIESWRNDDLTIWQDTIIPAFEAQNPDIKVVFAPSAPAEYNAVLNSKLAGRVGWRPDHLPARSTLRWRSSTRATLPTCPTSPAWRTSRRWRNRPGRPMTAQPPSACRWHP